MQQAWRKAPSLMRTWSLGDDRVAHDEAMYSFDPTVSCVRGEGVSSSISFGHGNYVGVGGAKRC